MYYWTKSLSEPIYGACHGSEVCYVLNTGRQIKSGDEHNPALASEVQQMWVNFASTGNPSTPAHYWPAYEATQRSTMVLGDTIRLENDPLPEQRKSIAPLMQEYVSPIFSDLLDKAPWYAGIAIGTLLAIVLLLIWLIVKLRRLFKKKSTPTNMSNMSNLSSNSSSSSNILIALLLIFTSLTATAQPGSYVPSEENLRAAVERVVTNHPELFVHFRTNDTGVEQVIDREQVLKIAVLSLKESDLDTFRAEFVHPFNLSNDLLCRFAVVRTEKALYLYSDIPICSYAYENH
jgi:hypothetical protein